MRMSKEQIIFVLVIMSLMGICGAVTYFYFWARLQVYAEDVRTEEHLKATLDEFEKNFSKTQPKALISAIQAQVQPWNEARDRWGAMFSMDPRTLERFNPRPEEQFPKFWYDEESTRLLSELRMKILQTQPNLVFPGDIYDLFGVPRLEDWKMQENVTEAMAKNALMKLSFGIAMFERLLNNKVTVIETINIWEPRKEERFGDIVRLRTVGLAFRIGLKDLVGLMESLNAEDRYITVEGISLAWLQPWYEPQLEVKMLVTQALWTPPEKRPVGRAAGPAAPGAPKPAAAAAGARSQLSTAAAPQAPTQPGIFSRAWRWIKQNILIMH